MFTEQPQNSELKEKKRHPRLLTIVTFSISLSVCLFLIYNVWVKWKTVPSIVLFSDQLVSVGEVPFPAVTICPQAKIKQRRFNYTGFITEMYKTDININNTFTYETFIKKIPSFSDFIDADLVCAETSLHSTTPEFKIRKYSDHSVVHNIQKVSPSHFDVFTHCMWRNQMLACFELFDEVLTSEGICYTFNTLAAVEIFRNDSIQQNYLYLDTTKRSSGWSPEHGYSNNEADSYPRRGRSNSGMPDLQVMFEEDLANRDPYCNALRVGYKIFLHHPSDLPQSSLFYYSALPGQLSSFAIKVNIINTSDTLNSYSPEIRQCYFPSEVQLKYFQLYTPNNCRLECLSNYTYKHCGCFWFHMPHNNSSIICSGGSKECVTSAHENFAAEESLGNLKESICQCLPLCTSIQYDADVLKTKYDVNKYQKLERKISNEANNMHGIPNDFDSYVQTKIEIYFKEPRFISMRRSELFGQPDFLANCGGLLELFLCFSFLSLVLIAYFLTLRFVSMRRSELFRLMDFLVNCGGLLGLFLSLVLIAYFLTLRFVSMRRSELFRLMDFLVNCGGLLGLFLSLVLIAYFLTLRFVSMRRSELFRLMDFLVNCGGLLGLFLSLVLIAYFLTLRFVSMRRSELFRLMDFLVNCGGLLGLFLSLVLIAYFLTLRFVSMRRSELFRLMDFLVNCGGLLGLLLSLVEIAYFLTLRFVSMQRSELFGLTDFLGNCCGLLGLFRVEIAYFLTLRLGCGMCIRNEK